MSWASLDSRIRTIAQNELTEKQLDVFKLYVAGCGHKRIAMMLFIGIPTARTHLDAANHTLAKHGVLQTGPRSYVLKEAA